MLSIILDLAEQIWYKLPSGQSIRFKTPSEEFLKKLHYANAEEHREFMKDYFNSWSGATDLAIPQPVGLTKFDQNSFYGRLRTSLGFPTDKRRRTLGDTLFQDVLSQATTTSTAITGKAPELMPLSDIEKLMASWKENIDPAEDYKLDLGDGVKI